MCIAPISIPNPNYGKNPKNGSAMALKDCSSFRINVPCGHCPECIAKKQMEFTQRVQMDEKIYNMYFITLTYDNDHLPKITTSTGYSIAYVDIKDLQNMFKRLRKRINEHIKYIAVTERGTQKGRPHAHIILYIPKQKGEQYYDVNNQEQTIKNLVKLEWRRNYGSTRKPVYEPLFTYKEKIKNGKLYKNFDCHLLRQNTKGEISENVAFYVTKYILKANPKENALQQALHINLEPEEYKDTWKLVKSKMLCSKGIGSAENPNTIKYLEECIEYSKKIPNSEYPMYFNKEGKSFPLAKYYKNKGKIYKMEDALEWYYRKNTETTDTPIIPKETERDAETHQQKINKLQKNEKILKTISIDIDSGIDEL